MAVAFDAKAGTVTHQASASSPITNTTLTAGGSASLVIGVFLGGGGASQAVPSAMTWGGASMTLVGNIAATDNSSDIYIYAIIAPATGNQTCSCTFTPNSSINADLDCFSFSGTNVGSVALCIPSSNVATDASTPVGNYPATPWSVTTVSGDAVVAVSNSLNGNANNPVAGNTINHEGAADINYTSFYELATTTSTSAQFTVVTANQPVCGIVLRITQPDTTLSAQIWI